MEMVVVILLASMGFITMLLGFFSTKIPTLCALLAMIFFSLTMLGMANVTEPYQVVWDNAGSLVVQDRVRSIVVNEQVSYIFGGLALINFINFIYSAMTQFKQDAEQ